MVELWVTLGIFTFVGLLRLMFWYVFDYTARKHWRQAQEEVKQIMRKMQ